MKTSAAPLDRSIPALFRTLYGLLNARQRRQLFVTLFVMLLGAAAEMVTIGAVVPFLLSALGPRGGGPLAGGDSRLAGAALLLAGAAVAAALVQIVLLRVSQRFVLTLGHEIGRAIFRRMLRQPYGYYVTRNTSEILVGIERVQYVVASLLPVMQGAIAAGTALFIALLLFALHPAAAALALGSMVTVYLAISLGTRARLRRNSAILAQAGTERMKTVREGLGGIRDILLDQSQEVFEERFRELDARWRHAQATNHLLARSPRYVVEAAGLVLVAILAVVMSRQPGGIVAAIPVLGAFALGAQRLLPLLQQSYSGWSTLVGSHQVVADVLALTQMPVVTSVPRSPDEAPVPFAREIGFHGVSFRYDGRAGTLRGIELRIPKGTRLGIVGKTGSGKSTLLDLFMGLLDPTGGEIRIDGRVLDDAARANWQAQIAHVPQAIYLADRSIAANIAFGEHEEHIDMERVREAARRAEIDGFVDGLPEGYATPVGERGIRISGGQRQRIGIARALYRRPGVLILDEATSALDEATEADVLRSIAGLGRDVTIVLVTHRLSNLSGCDLVVRLENGAIAESGSFGEVAGRARPLAGRG